MTLINSLGIKLGNANCRIACASLTEWGSLKQFSTKTLFTVKANAEYSGGFEQCLANADEFHPSKIVFDALNLKNSNSISYSDDEFGDIFAKKQENGKYKLEFCEENDQQNQNVEYQDIEVTAGILAKLMEAANEQLPEKGAELQQIVITVPSLAEYEYREKMMKAMKILGLPSNIDIQFIAQITAAAIAYRHKESDLAQGNVLFFYMGARNTEFALYKFLDGQTPELLYADGFVDFGGENFTAQIVKQQMAILKEENRQKWERKMGDEEKRTVYRNVRMAMEKIKAQLGCKESATVKMDLGPTLHGQKFTIAREQFEETCKNQCQQLASFLIPRLKHFKEQINRIVLIGESSKLYLVQNLFCKFNEKLILPMNALAPELAAVQGAAIKASYEALKRNGNTLPKCLTKAIIPNYTFHGIYGTIYQSDLPSYLAHFGQQIPTNDIPIKTFMDVTWHEEYSENNKEIMKFSEFGWRSEKYFVKIDKNGLLRFKHSNGQIWSSSDGELEKCMKKFKQYELDVLRVKLEQTEWEKKRKEERRLKAQREMEEKKRQQQLEEEAKKAQELANKQKLIDEENEKKLKEEAKLKLKYSKNQQEEKKENRGTTETKVVDKAEGGNEKKKSATLVDDKVLDESFEVVPSTLKDDFDIDGQKKTATSAECSTSTTPEQQWKNSGSHQNQKHKDYIDVLIEIANNRGKPVEIVYLIGSWDEWKGKIPMKYSQFTNSFLAMLSLPISKGEYEFLYVHENDEQNIWRYYEEYPNRNPPKTLKLNHYCRNWRVNFVEINSTTQNGNQNSSWTINKYLLEKIVNADDSMVKLENHLKNYYYMLKLYGNNIKQKYLEIRNTLSKQLQINLQDVNALTYEAAQAHTYLEIIIFVESDWAKIERGSKVLKKCENANKIRVDFMKKLLQFTMSKEEAIHQFKHYFCYPLLEECIRNGLEHGVSKEIQQLKTFIDANFLHNLPTGSPV